MLIVSEREYLPVADARAGNAEAWKTLFRRYRLPLYVYGFELLRDEQASLDLVRPGVFAAGDAFATLTTVNMPPMLIGPNCPSPAIMGNVLVWPGMFISSISCIPSDEPGSRVTDPATDAATYNGGEFPPPLNCLHSVI
jgi:hypothetical protein